ncbi:diphenol oxidase [Magnaporthiopsis poae ATCC 64411]|uniref:Diphenol oxidase n=1 Tax=Magnaporthiopsis poae (strain ATCC 64411 / 73-15) TaxID=644358 RepID=A0A0C4DTZ0_MAGP6|nr:diphenol oxidase [Magnaporthiopsis poae ATCC 64411]
MDPESQRREEREELLAGHDGEYEPKQTRRAAPPAPVKRLSSPVMIVACAVSILALVGFAMSFFITTQSQPPSSGGSQGSANMSDHTGTGTGTVSSTTAASSTPTPAAISNPASIIPKDDFFNLDVAKSGFVVETKPRARDYEFNITRGMGSPDGIVKPMILVNGQSPGPTVEANVGDAVRVIMYNSLVNETATIHWHGIDQRNTAWMDGVPGVTQCAIPPGQSFVYEFIVPNQRGTFWYHAHVSVQYTDGLYGAFIIHDPDEKIAEHHHDRLVFMGDMHHRYGGDILSQYLSKSPDYAPNEAGTEPYPDNIIINGQHLFNCTKPDSDDASAFTGEGCKAGSRHVTRVEAGKTVRLRLISHSSNTPFLFTVDGHVLEIVEIDGVEVHPISTTLVFLNPGQRYSVLVRTDRAPGNYLMRAVATCSMLDPNPDSNLGTVGNQGTAVFSYGEGVDPKGPLVVMNDSNKATVAQEPWDRRCHDLPFDLAKPVREIDAYEVGDRNKHSFRFKFIEDDHGVQRTIINDTVYAGLPNGATLWQVPQQDVTPQNMNSSDPKYAWKPAQHVFVSRDEAMGAEVAISAGNMMGHPWHLHGQQFQIVGWGRGTFGKRETTWNFKNPLRRDTVTVPGHSHVVIRYVADNPGVWALHCHIQWHAEGGMFVQTAQRLSKLQDLLKALPGFGDIKYRFCPPSPPRSIGGR